MAWTRRGQVERVDYSTFNPEKEYTGKQLEAYAEALLRDDGKTDCEHGKARSKCRECSPNILFDEHLYTRRKREWSVDPLKIDPAFSRPLVEDHAKTKGDGQGMYNRQSPEGRKVNTPEQRAKHGASYYK